MVYVNGREFKAQQDGETFTAAVNLSEGDNPISAACQQTDGAEIRSNMLNFTERLRQIPRAEITIALDGEAIILDGGKSRPVEGDGSKIIDHIWMTSHSQTMLARKPWLSRLQRQMGNIIYN
jgi:hypothetical protein